MIHTSNLIYRYANGAALRADFAHAGKSRSLQWLGTEAFSPVLSLTDEADFEGAAYCFPFDGEGVAISRNEQSRSSTG